MPSLDVLVGEIAQKAKTLWKPSPRRVINATGVVIHTNLGRAPLSEEAANAAMEAGAGYSDLEIDLEKGERGGRDATLKSSLAGSPVPSPAWPLTTTPRPYTSS